MIDENKLKEQMFALVEQIGDERLHIDAVVQLIDDAQTVDAVEVVRCRECKYNSNPPECGNAACVLFYGMTDQMGFCHHGERRERE